ncbi:hypothetical protein AB0K51_20290 [Kitasatospora sp. NPDC049285]|uniref:hypothetical protein n=1 Tax=Kitasatospora sp. NPDC049285 TaxID=3157096 RepID=UPI003427AE3E
MSHSPDQHHGRHPEQHHEHAPYSPYGLRWDKDFALSFGPDGSVAVDRDAGGKYGWAVACRAVTRKLLVEPADSADSADGAARPVEPLDTAVFRALQARDAIVGHACGPNVVAEFTRRTLVLARGPQWDDAVSTALIGGWADPLNHGGRIDASVVGRIKSEAEALHRAAVPVWRRRVRGSRVLLLETPIGDGLTLLDLVAGELRMDDLVFEAAFDDPRVAAVVAQLTRAERAVAMAWAHPSTGSWAEAARFAGRPDPEAFGERVRRKLKRLGDRYTARTRAAATTADGTTADGTTADGHR